MCTLVSATLLSEEDEWSIKPDLGNRDCVDSIFDDKPRRLPAPLVEPFTPPLPMLLCLTGAALVYVAVGDSEIWSSGQSVFISNGRPAMQT